MAPILRTRFAIPLAAALIAASGADAAIIYVRANRPTNGNGTSWTNAFNNLQSALAVASPGDEIHIAAGTYRPTVERDPGQNRSRTFRIKGGVRYLGGFPANGGTIADRNPTLNQTILSGDLANNDGPNFANTSDNAYHVLFLDESMVNTVLDGLIVQGGNANVSFSGFDYERGGGVFITGNIGPTPPIFRDCVIRSNQAIERGAGVDASRAVFVGCTFIANRTGELGEGGGAIVGNASFYNCRFLGNQANHGGGLQHGSGTLELVNCFFSGNRAQAAAPDQPGLGGGALVLGTSGTSIICCTFVGNAATAQSGVDQVDAQGGGLYMTAGSGSNVAKVYNSILWDNTRMRVNPFSTVNDQAAQIYQPGGITATLRYNIVQNLAAGIGQNNSTASPMFVDANGPDNVYGTLDDNPAVQLFSAAVDSGDSNVMPSDIYDLDGDGITNEPISLDVMGNPRYVDIPATANTGIGGLWVDRGAYEAQRPFCYANCDGSTQEPVLNVNDFVCFQGLFAAGDVRANCDNSTTQPILNVNDFVCFQSRFAAGCP